MDWRVLAVSKCFELLRLGARQSKDTSIKCCYNLLPMDHSQSGSTIQPEFGFLSWAITAQTHLRTYFKLSVLSLSDSIFLDHGVVGVLIHSTSLLHLYYSILNIFLLHLITWYSLTVTNPLLEVIILRN